MSKPAGIYMALSGKTVLMGITPTDRIADKVWEAVQEAICGGWTVQRFKNESAQAWEHELKERAKSDAEEWRKP